jgi:hypothetical protein
MRITEVAKDKILNGDGIYNTKTIAQLDVRIDFDHRKKGKIYATVYLVERDTNVPVFILDEGIPVHDRGSITLQSPDGFISIPVELQ